jgi:phage tail-like protein
MATFQGARHDPFRGFKFRVVIDGFTSAGFQKCTGLKEETEITEYREGTDPVTMHKLPGLTSYDNIVLERGMSPNDDFKKWREDIVRIAESGNLGPDGLPTPDFRRNVIVELYDKGGVKVKEWEVLEAWPAVLEIGDLDAESSDVLIETLELANEGHRQTM